MINKLRAKMNENEVYNVRNPPGKSVKKLEKEKTVAVGIILENLCNQALKK